jgi:hypothetical protein
MITVWYLVFVLKSNDGGSIASLLVPEPTQEECVRIAGWEKSHSLQGLWDVQCIQGVK